MNDITGEMVGVKSPDDAKKAAAKIITDQVGALLDIRGLPLKGMKPMIFSEDWYGARFTFKDGGPLEEGRAVRFAYDCADHTARVEFEWPSYTGIDGRLIEVEPSRAKVDYDSWDTPEEEPLAKAVLKDWDAKQCKQVIEGKTWKDVLGTRNKTPLSDLTIASKKIEELWPLYVNLFRISSYIKSESVKCLTGFKKSFAGIEKIWGKPSAIRDYEDSATFEYNTASLGDVSIQMATSGSGGNHVSDIKFADRDEFIRFIKHINRFKPNGG